MGQKLWQQKIFSQAKGVYIVHDKSRGVEQQIIFLAWYPEAAIHSQGSLTDGNAFTSIQYQDAIWNTAVAVSGHDLQIIKSYFAWRAQQKIIFDLSATEIPGEIPGQRLLVSGRYTATTLPRKDVSPALEKWVQRNDSTFEDQSDLLFVEQIPPKA